MKRIKNTLATDVNEKITKREYIAFGSSTAVSKAATALSGTLGGLVASTYMGLSDESFKIYSTIIFILGFWDIANDVIVSSFLDKTRKTYGNWGRFKPWIMLMLIPFNLVVIMQTAPLKAWFPDISDAFKVTYLVLLFFLNDAFSTFYNAALTALNARRTTNNMERGYLAAIESILSSTIGACGTYIAAVLPYILPNASEAGRYFYSYSIITILAIPLTIWNIVVTKERISEPPKAEAPKLRTVYKQIIKNKPLMMYMISEIFGHGMSVGYGLMTYAFIACFKNTPFTLTLFKDTAIQFDYVYDGENFMALLSLASISSLVTTGISLFLAPIIRKWVDDKILYMCTRLGTALCYTAMFFSVFPFSAHTPAQIFVRIVIWYAIHGLTTGFYQTVPGLIQMAAYDYAEHKYGERNEATVSSLKNTLSRILGNCTNYVTNLFLVYVGYTAYANTPELMPTESKASLLYIFALCPAIFCYFAVIPMFFYKLSGKKHKQIVDELNEKRQRNLDEINKVEKEKETANF
ncbi:MAG: MFS transporter [Acutalibacteraceae bacterium]|nr:MFS transporter [Acutalibacteraceae bacterium]